MTIAQAILESGWGESGLTKASNNLFGIKGSSKWGSVSYPTKEYVNGKYVNTTANFRKYPSYTESIADHTQFLTAARYRPVLSENTCLGQCSQLYKCGYATDINYANKLMNLIEQYDLYKYDVQVQKSEDVDVYETYILEPAKTYVINVDGKKVRIIVTSC